MKKISGRQFSLFLITVILCSLLILMTPLGSKLFISLLERSIPTLKIELHQGSLFFSPQFSRFSYANDFVEIDATNVKAHVKLSCLWRSTVCINPSFIDKLSINILQREEKSKSEVHKKDKSDNNNIALFINEANINTMTLTHQNFELTGKELNASFNFLDKDLIIDQLNAQSLLIKNLSSKVANKNETLITNITSIQRNVSDIASISIPINISLNASFIEHVTYQNNSPASSPLDPDKPQLLILQKLITSFTQHNKMVDNIVVSVNDKKDTWQLSGNLTLTQALNHKLSINALTTHSEFGQNRLTLNSTGNVNNLIFDVQSIGDINAQTSGDLSLTQPKIPINASGTWQPFIFKPIDLQVSTGDISFSGDLSHLLLQANTTATYPNLPAVTGVFTGNISEQGITLDNTQLKTLNGDITLNGMITWQEKLTLNAQVALKHIQPHQFWPTFTGQLNGTLDTEIDLNKQWRVNLSNMAINGELFNEPLMLTGNINGHAAPNQYQWGNWQVDNVVLKHAQNIITVNGLLAKHTQLNAIISAENIGTSLPQFTHEHPGEVEGTASLIGDINALAFNTTLNATNIYYQPKALTFKRASLIASSTLSAQLPFDVKLSASEINYNDKFKNNTLTASLMGDKNDHVFNASLKAPTTLEQHEEKKSGHINIAGRINGQQWLGTITTAKFENNNQQLTLSSPLDITANIVEKSINIANHCWSATLDLVSQQSSLCLTAPFAIDTKKMRSNEAMFKFSHFSMAQLQPYLPKQHQVSGEVNGDLSFQIFSDDKLSLSSTLQWLNGAIDSEFNDSIVRHDITQLTLNTNIDRQFANIIAHLSSPTLGVINASVVSNIFDETPFINGHIRSKGLELAPYRPFLTNISALNGQINVSAGFSGTLKQQQIFGQLTSTDISVASNLLPSKIENLKTQLDFNGTHATFNSAFNLANGKGKINGVANWDKGLVAQLSLLGSSLALTPQKGINVVVSPDITMNLTSKIAKIRGNLTIDKANIDIKSLPDKAISLSDDVIIKQVKSATNQATTPNNMALDIDVHTLLGEQFIIDAFGLKSTVQGDLNIIQNQQLPLSSYGELTLVDAKYKAFGQYLDIETGQLIFTGAMSNPILNIKAVRDPQETEDDVIVGVNIKGEVDNPELTIFSIPVMEDQQALSYLMRGFDLDPDEEFGSDMAIALIVNSGLSGASNTIDNLGSAVGINNFNVTTSGSGDSTRLKFSGSIGPNLQLRYGVGVFDALPEVGLRYKINKQLFIEFINDTNQALDILYQFSFD